MLFQGRQSAWAFYVVQPGDTLSKYGKVIKFAGRSGTVFTWVIPSAIAGYESYQAYGTDKFGETAAGGAGRVVGGVGGSAAAYAICAASFAGPSAGTSIFWCTVVLGTGLGMAFSSTGEAIGKGTYRSFTHKGSNGGPVDPRLLKELMRSQMCTIPKVGS